MKMKTQASSEAKFKHDAFNDDTLKAVGENYHKMDLETYRSWCAEILNSARGKKEKIIAIVRAVEQTNYKEAIMKKTYDFILAGMGLAV